MLKPVVLIGASAGGPDTIVKILISIRSPLNFPIVIALHNMASQVENFVKLLKRSSTHEIIIINGREIIKNAVFLAKGGKDVVFISREVISAADPESYVVPSIDRLFLSVKNMEDLDFYIFLLGGLGSDGVKGLMELENQENVHIYIQDDAKFLYIPMNAMRNLKRYRKLSLFEIIRILNHLNSIGGKKHEENFSC